MSVTRTSTMQSVPFSHRPRMIKSPRKSLGDLLDFVLFDVELVVLLSFCAFKFSFCSPVQPFEIIGSA